MKRESKLRVRVKACIDADSVVGGLHRSLPLKAIWNDAPCENANGVSVGRGRA